MNARAEAKYITLQCFRCDDRRVVKLAEIKWDILGDVRCTVCGCTGTTHIVGVVCEKTDYTATAVQTHKKVNTWP